MSIVIAVRVKPNSRQPSLEQGADGVWIARVQAPPVDGRANEELVGLVARQFGCPKRAISIRSGAGGRHKLVQIERG